MKTHVLELETTAGYTGVSQQRIKHMLECDSVEEAEALLLAAKEGKSAELWQLPPIGANKGKRTLVRTWINPGDGWYRLGEKVTAKLDALP